MEINKQLETELAEPTVETTNYQDSLKRQREQALLSQNYPFGLIAGIVAGIIGALLWAAITVATEFQIGYMAIAIGLLVGFTIRTFGKGIESIYGITGAAISLLSCLLGNYLSVIGFVANAEGMGYFEILSVLNYTVIPEIMVESFNPMDILFYGLAVYEGYKFSVINQN